MAGPAEATRSCGSPRGVRPPDAQGGSPAPEMDHFPNFGRQKLRKHNPTGASQGSSGPRERAGRFSQQDLRSLSIPQNPVKRVIPFFAPFFQSPDRRRCPRFAVVGRHRTPSFRFVRLYPEVRGLATGRMSGRGPVPSWGRTSRTRDCPPSGAAAPGRVARITRAGPGRHRLRGRRLRRRGLGLQRCGRAVVVAPGTRVPDPHARRQARHPPRKPDAG